MYRFPQVAAQPQETHPSADSDDDYREDDGEYDQDEGETAAREKDSEIKRLTEENKRLHDELNALAKKSTPTPKAEYRSKDTNLQS